MLSLLLALAALSAPWQGSAPAQSEHELLDGVALQAGEKLVTLSEYVRAVKRYMAQVPPANAAEEQALRAQLVRDLTTLRLEEQSGADLGLDPAQIDRISRQDQKRQRDRAGLDAYLSDLEAQGKDALTEDSDRRQDIFRYFWEQAAQGKAFAAKRATRDEAIRPGELRAIYAENRERLAPAKVQLRWLIVTSDIAGSPEAARASCEDARKRVLAGEDLELLIQERGAEFRDSRGLTPFVTPGSIRDPALAAFAEKAQIGDLSEVLPLVNPPGYQLVQLHDREQPEIPAFDTPGVQRALRGYFTKQRKELVLGRAREQLNRDSYTWVNPLLGGGTPAQAPQRP